MARPHIQRRSAITDYLIQRSPNGTSGWVTINDGVHATTGYTVTGLANGTRYYFRVLARNAAGTGPASIVVSQIPLPVPTAVRSLAAAPTNVSGQLRLTWLAPASNGGCGHHRLRHPALAQRHVGMGHGQRRRGHIFNLPTVPLMVQSHHALGRGLKPQRGYFLWGHPFLTVV